MCMNVNIYVLRLLILCDDCYCMRRVIAIVRVIVLVNAVVSVMCMVLDNLIYMATAIICY